MRNYLFLISVIVVLKFAYTGVTRLYTSVALTESKSMLDFHASFKKNDSWWYQKIAQEGYPEIRVREEIGFSEGKVFKQSAWAFFPAYPMLISSVQWLFSCSSDKAMLAISLVCSILTFLGLYYFLQKFSIQYSKYRFFFYCPRFSPFPLPLLFLRLLYRSALFRLFDLRIHQYTTWTFNWTIAFDCPSRFIPSNWTGHARSALFILSGTKWHLGRPAI